MFFLPMVSDQSIREHSGASHSTKQTVELFVVEGIFFHKVPFAPDIKMYSDASEVV